MQSKKTSSDNLSIPGLGGPLDASRLRLMRRVLAECASLMEDRAFGAPRPASDGVFAGGPASRSAVASLVGCGLISPSSVADISAACASGGLPLPLMLSVASDRAEALMSGKIAPLCGSCGAVEAALIPGLVRKASVLIAEVAAFDAFGRLAASSLAAALGSHRRTGAAALDVDVMVRRWRREAEDADPDAAIARYLADASAGRKSAALVALRKRRAASARPRRRPSPKLPS